MEVSIRAVPMVTARSCLISTIRWFRIEIMTRCDRSFVRALRAEHAMMQDRVETSSDTKDDIEQKLRLLDEQYKRDKQKLIRLTSVVVRNSSYPRFFSCAIFLLILFLNG